MEALRAPAVDLDELRRCTALLEAIAADRALLAQVPDDERIALLTAVGRIAQPDRSAVARLTKAVHRAQKREAQARDRERRAQTQIRAVRQQTVFAAPPPRPAAQPASTGQRLESARNCYVCKAEYRDVHFFYDALCVECGELNYQKRFQTAPLEGQVALITGGRVKIGYQASLMLLRAGATVLATTRFPQDAALRYAREPDFATWSQRLQVHGLDLRHAPSVEIFARHLEATHRRLDIILNNAAQTVRRPPGFYAHLLPLELRPLADLPAEARALLASHTELAASVHPERPSVHPERSRGTQPRDRLGVNAGGGTEITASWRSQDPALGIHASALLSQVPYDFEQDAHRTDLFPDQKLDADLQQVDLRRVNTWRLTLSEVATVEMLEVYLVNAVAPFILNGKLKPLMLRDRSSPGHIVNVSAMEGSFSRGTKTDKHPHTNMAKAALNMMTLTSAQDYARSNIYMNAVDTGWVTDEDPAAHAQRKQSELDFQPPLDIVDGAARILDPVFCAINSGDLVFGRFYKDYRQTPW